jgi:hypothetical protein
MKLKFYFKTGLTENGKICSPFSKVRDDAIVIYSDDENLAKYVNIVNSIIQKNGIVLDEPPITVGKIKGTNIGIGAEPNTNQKKTAGRSFNVVRNKVINEAYNELAATYKSKNIIKYSSQYYQYFYTLLEQYCEKNYVDPSKFYLNIETIEKERNV